MMPSNAEERRLYVMYKGGCRAHRFLLGFEDGGYIYAVVPPEDLIADRLFSRAQSTSHGLKQALALRRLKDAQKKRLIASGAVRVGTLEMLMSYAREWSEKLPNRGYGFQWMLEDLLGLPQKRHDNIGFWEAPDLSYKGVDYQVKFDTAQIASYEDIKKHGKERA